MRQPGWLPADGGTGAIPAGGCAGGPGPCRSLTKQQPGREVNDRKAKGSGRSGPAPYLHPPGSAAPGTAPASCLGQLPPPQLQGHKGRLQGLGAVGRHACERGCGHEAQRAPACLKLCCTGGRALTREGLLDPTTHTVWEPPGPPPPQKKGAGACAACTRPPCRLHPLHPPSSSACRLFLASLSQGMCLASAGMPSSRPAESTRRGWLAGRG